MEEQNNDEIVKYLLNKTTEYVKKESLKEAVASYETMVMMLLRENMLLRKQEINKDLLEDTNTYPLQESKKKKSLLVSEDIET